MYEHKNNSLNSGSDNDSVRHRDIIDDVHIDFARVRKVDRTRPDLRYVKALEDILAGEFTPVAEVRSEDEEAVNLAMIMINLDTTTQGLSAKFKFAVRKTFYTLFQFWTSAPLTLIMVTDERSVSSVARFMAGLLARETSLRLLTTKSKRWRKVDTMPKVRVHFVNAVEIAEKNLAFVKRLQSVTVQSKDNKTVEDDRYMADLFYIAPIYHLALSALDKMIVIDATDLEFHNSIELLQDQFRHVTGGKLIGIGNDLSVNYYHNLAKYRFLNEGSQLGFHGDKQGFNTGVVLYNLAEMRRSALYNSYLTPTMVTMLEKRYMYGYTLAEQDWFTSLYYSHPGLFHVLPCRFNRQTSIQYLKPPNEEYFELFHACEPKSDNVITHTNGCGPKPGACDIQPESANYTGTYWKTHSTYMEDPHMEMCGMWVRLAILEDKVYFDTCPQYAV